MHQPRRLRLTASIVLCFVLQALGADKYTDENRPYEFGFKIDGQHRHESKDKEGIIMGEFGFITADDVYHVTVYATDKEGRFKILSMKNIHLKSSSPSNLGAPTSARQGHALALPPVQAASVKASAVPQGPQKLGGVPTPAQIGPFKPQAPVSQGAFASQPGKPYKPITIETPGKSCSSCSLPTTTTRAPPPAYNQVPDNNNYNSPNQFGAPGPSSQDKQGFPPSSPGQQNIAQAGPSSFSYNPQGQQAFPPSSPGQQNTAQGGPRGSSYSPQEGQRNYPSGQQTLPPSSPGRQNTAQGGPSGSSYSPQEGQRNYPSGQQALPPSSPGQQNTVQGGPSGSSYSPQEGQRNYPSGQQNIPQGLVAPGGAPSFATQPGQTVQIYPGSPSYSQGPGSPNAPNNYSPGGGAFSSSGQTQSGGAMQADLFGGNNNPYAGAAPNGAETAVPHSGNFGQNNIQQAGLSRPNSQPTGQSSYPQGEAGERTSKQYNGPEQQFDSKLSPQGPGATQGGQRGSNKPTLFSAQMQIVDRNTDVFALAPNEQRGLPPGISQGDMTQLLYTFNYTVGFHGHFEEGYTNGDKKGYYFVTGRNGVRTRIDYVADVTGFHPKVSQEVLDLLSEDVPKPETEKDEKYGLKGYEFKWLYYPVESKKR